MTRSRALSLPDPWVPQSGDPSLPDPQVSRSKATSLPDPQVPCSPVSLALLLQK